MSTSQTRSRVLAIDIGSSSARAALFDETGQIVAGTLRRVTYRLETGPDGRAELDAGTLAERIENLLDAVHQAAGSPVQAVGISCFWHSLVGLDRQGCPVTRVSMWADTRARAAALELRARVDAADHHRRTGAYLHPSYPIARFAWLVERLPELRTTVACWCAFPDYLFVRWTGSYRTSVSMASGSGLFDTWRLDWDEESCAAVGLDPHRLPVIDDADGRLVPAYAARWPRFADAVWYPAWGDGACSNVGSGAVGQDRATIMIGTSSAIRTLWRGEPLVVPWGLWLYRLDRELVLAGGALSEGGDLIDWIRQRFVLSPEPALWERVQTLEPGSTGLLWLPTIAGERSPGWPVDASAALVGLRLSHDGVAVLRAALEAVACRIAEVVDLLLEIRPGIEVFIGSGNALLGIPGWAQIVADATGRSLLLAPDPEASLRGAALVASARLTGRPLEHLARSDVAQWTCIMPNETATQVLRRQQEAIRTLHVALAQLNVVLRKE
ncbi:gluconokinase [Thermomicrobium sp. 4228-Ro]|uniref:gluconokinase n=1 Tax=Thermomicrobium sp. 4228-Ro TaxID=2993937 RepID=UPI0022494779|nr:gluconokinase [Thermomicrobium sp. 4228-Ro]MCX2726553.1 gluconokinase [Thermomicrobium sp. 4228-Ro]